MQEQFSINHDVLWDYLDGLLPNEEVAKVEQYLDSHPEWKSVLKSIQEERDALLSTSLDSVDPDFARTVMANWKAEMPAKAKNKPLDWGILGFALGFTLILGVPIIIFLGMAASSATPQSIALPDLQLEHWTTLLLSPTLHLSVLTLFALSLLQFISKYLLTQRRIQALSL